MKKMLIIMLWSVGWSGHFSAAQSKCAALTGGQVSGHVYTNKDLGLSYTFPESLKAESQDKLPKNKNSRLLLVLWKEPRDLGKPSIIILADDLSQYPDPTVTGYLRTIVNMAKRYNPPATVLEVGRQYDLSGIKFYRVDYEFPSPTPAYNVAITSQIQNCEISFDFTGRTKQEVETFVQSIGYRSLCQTKTLKLPQCSSLCLSIIQTHQEQCILKSSLTSGSNFSVALNGQARGTSS